MCACKNEIWIKIVDSKMESGLKTSGFKCQLY